MSRYYLTFGDFKQMVIQASPSETCPLELNNDLNEIMKDYTPGTKHIWDGFRLVHFNGRFMDDSETISQQVSVNEGDDVFLFKLVFMKQFFMGEQGKQMVKRLLKKQLQQVKILMSKPILTKVCLW